MDARINIKNRLPSRHVTEGPERAPHRSYYYAMGLTTAQIHQPFVGVASSSNEAAPDGIAMGHEGMKASLPSREVIADSVELTMRGHAYDALIGIAGCDKSLPGMMMAMCRRNAASILIYG